MSYEECPIHHDDATNGCRQCKCEKCGLSHYEHTEMLCISEQLKQSKELIERAISGFGDMDLTFQGMNLVDDMKKYLKK